MSHERRMAALFALGAACFVVAPFPGYAELVGAQADAITFFSGSLFFTGGGMLQAAITFPERLYRHCNDREKRLSSICLCA